MYQQCAGGAGKRMALSPEILRTVTASKHLLTHDHLTRHGAEAASGATSRPKAKVRMSQRERHVRGASYVHSCVGSILKRYVPGKEIKFCTLNRSNPW
jgi:hypothetical protein